MPLNRIYIIGTVGSGKSYLAKKLSEILNIKHYDLDDIFWAEKYNEKRNEKERNQLFRKLCNKKRWIIEGVYASWIEEGIKKSDEVILMDTPLHKLVWRLTKRQINREKSKKKGTKRYKESFIGCIGLIKKAIKYKNKNYPRGYYKHKELIGKHKIDFVCLKNKKQANDFLVKIEKSSRNIH